MEETKVCKVLVGILTDPHRSPALAALFRPRYLRELICRETDTEMMVHIFKRGFNRYKNHHPYPAFPPPPVHCEGIKDAINSQMPNDLIVSSVVDNGDRIILYIQKG